MRKPHAAKRMSSGAQHQVASCAPEPRLPVPLVCTETPPGAVFLQPRKHAGIRGGTHHRRESARDRICSRPAPPSSFGEERRRALGPSLPLAVFALGRSVRTSPALLHSDIGAGSGLPSLPPFVVRDPSLREKNRFSLYLPGFSSASCVYADRDSLAKALLSGQKARVGSQAMIL